MKKSLLILGVVISIAACKTADKKAPEAQLTPEQIEKARSDSANFTTIQWMDSTYLDLGKITKDQHVEVSFRFKNTGTKNLIFANVTPGCGCTLTEKPTKPFVPGEIGFIKATYNGSGHGKITKEMYVEANTKPSTSHVLTFTGEVIEK